MSTMTYMNIKNATLIAFLLVTVSARSEETLFFRCLDVLRGRIFQGTGRDPGTDDGDLHDGRIDTHPGLHGEAQGTYKAEARNFNGTDIKVTR